MDASATNRDEPTFSMRYKNHDGSYTYKSKANERSLSRADSEERLRVIEQITKYREAKLHSEFERL